MSSSNQCGCVPQGRGSAENAADQPPNPPPTHQSFSPPKAHARPPSSVLCPPLPVFHFLLCPSSPPISVHIRPNPTIQFMNATPATKSHHPVVHLPRGRASQGRGSAECTADQPPKPATNPPVLLPPKAHARPPSSVLCLQLPAKNPEPEHVKPDPTKTK